MRILLLCGASGVGKSSIAYEICKNSNYFLVKSYTDRPKRKDDLDHIYVPTEEIGFFPIKDVVAVTKIAGYTYCTLSDSFVEDKINVYVVDKPGMDQVKRFFPDAHIVSVLITRKNVYIDDKRKKRNIIVPKKEDVTFCIQNDVSVKLSADLIKEILQTMLIYEGNNVSIEKNIKTFDENNR